MVVVKAMTMMAVVVIVEAVVDKVKVDSEFDAGLIIRKVCLRRRKRLNIIFRVRRRNKTSSSVTSLIDEAQDAFVSFGHWLRRILADQVSIQIDSAQSAVQKGD